MRFISTIILVLFLSSGATANNEISFAETPEWIKPTSLAKPDEEYQDLAAQVLLIDRQIRHTETEIESFSQSAIVIQTPEGLTHGNIAIPWSPQSEKLTVHHVRIIRDGETINVLEGGQTFSVLQREPGLEFSILDGMHTASLQPQDLRVDDILSLAYTVSADKNTLKGHSGLFLSSLLALKTNKLNIRQIWPNTIDLSWKASPDLPRPKIRKTKNGSELTIQMHDVDPPVVPLDAPTRFYLYGAFEATDFKTWSQASTLIHAFMEPAISLEPSSPLIVEARKIAQSVSSQEARAEKALQLVQEKIRYLYDGLQSDGYRPEHADDVWRRRYGDCKGKSAVLLALLKELDIDADAVLVSSVFGKGLQQRLPNLRVFDHMIVRAKIDNETYFLDGARIGDMSLKTIPPSMYGWALPVAASDADLIPVPTPPIAMPTSETRMTIDARKGFRQNANVEGVFTIRGDLTIALRQQYASLSEDQIKQNMNAYASQLFGGIRITDVTPTISQEENVLSLDFQGDIGIKWETYDGVRRYTIPFSALNIALDRFISEDRKIPWALPAPTNNIMQIDVKLPVSSNEYHYDGKPVNIEKNGLALENNVSISDGVLTLKRRTRVETSELSADDARWFAKEVSNADMKHTFSQALNSAALNTPPASIADAMIRKEDWSIEAEPETTQDFVERGLKYLDAKDYDNAFTDFTNAINLNPRNVWAYANRGLVNFYQENYGAAKRDVEKALSLDEKNWVAMQGLGRFAERDENYALAIEHYTASLEGNSKQYFAVGQRGYAYLKLKQFEKALADFDDYIEKAPDREFGYAMKTSALVEMDRQEDALKWLNRMIEQYPERAPLYLLRSDLHERTNNLTAALTDLNKAVSLRPDDAISLNDRCWFRATRNMELQKALADCDRALEQYPDNAALLDSRGLVYFRLNNMQKSILDFDAALKAHARQPGSLYTRGLAKRALGDAQGAEQDIERAKTLTPDIEAIIVEYGLEDL